MVDPTGSPGPISQVREGMKVQDSAGAEVGSVDQVKLSDPEADTTAGQQPPENTGPTAVPPIVPATPAAGAGSGGVPVAAPIGILATGNRHNEPDVPPSLAERLLRTGYLKIDSKGLFTRDLYVGADHIERIDADTVVLDTTKDHLIKEE
ncbi:MAG TPA: hypothetical protein VHC49_27630 [Mycobacteriales bacterium]|nr:hypothetical protein [Mycobacteriales bacterium]